MSSLLDNLSTLLIDGIAPFVDTFFSTSIGILFVGFAAVAFVFWMIRRLCDMKF